MRFVVAAGTSCLAGDPWPAVADSVRGPLLPWARLKFPCRGGDMDVYLYALSEGGVVNTTAMAQTKPALWPNES